MKTRLGFVLMIISVAWMLDIALAQPDPLTEWTATFGGVGADFGSDVLVLEDGSYLMCGTTYVGGARDFMLIKADPTGAQIWKHTFGGSGEEECTAMAPTSDGGCIIVGVTTSYGAGGADMWAVRVNAQGDTVWTRAYGGSGTEAANAVVALSGDQYLLAGLTNSFGSTYDVFAVKINGSGDTLWTRVWDYGMAERAYSIVVAEAGGFLFAGSSGPEGPYQNKDLFAVKTNGSGNVEWIDKWESPGEQEANGAVEMSDGSFMLAGYSFPLPAGLADCRLMKVSSSGDSLWTRTYDLGGDDRLNDITVAFDGNYVATGWAQRPTHDFALLKANQAGDSLWTRFMGGNGTEEGMTVRAVDCGYVLAGYTNSFGAGDFDFWLVKTGPDVLQNMDAVTLVSGSLNGTPVIDGVLEVEVEPGASLNLNLTIQAYNTLPPTSVAPLVMVWSWGEHESSYMTIDSWIPSSFSTHEVTTTLTAPTEPGVYYVTFAHSGETGPQYVASLTNWPWGTPHWNDGVDIADWADDQYAQTLEHHAATTQYESLVGYYCRWVGAAMIKVTIAEEPVPEPMLVHIRDHFCLHFEPGVPQVVYWCCPYEGPAHFSWLPGCEYQLPGCQEVCPPYIGPVTWTKQYDSSNAECPLPGGWFSARFTAEGEGCACVFFEYQEAVELIDFAATASDRNVTLRWATASETDNDRFEIHRSSEGGAWARIGTVAGHGTSSTAHHYSYLDEAVESGIAYSYRLASVDLNGAMEWVGDIVSATPGTGSAVAGTYALQQNHPNPFNPSTEIAFEIAEAGHVALKVFNVAGQEVATLLNGPQNSGLHRVTFNGSALPSGVYFYSLSANDFSATRKMLLLK